MADKFTLRIDEHGALQLRFPDGAELSLNGDEAVELGRKLIAASEGSGDTTIIIDRGSQRYIIELANIH